MTFLHDIRFAVRQLRRDVGFTATTILTLALGIGATTAMFSLVHAVLLRPLPFPEQDQLMWVLQRDATTGAPEPLSYPDFLDWREQNRSFTGMASYHAAGFTITGRGDARHVSGHVVSHEFFRVLGAQPLLGRTFRPEEEKPGSRVTVLSHSLWRSAFDGARDVIGRTVTLDGNAYTIVGVMPPGFAFPIQNPPDDLWTTLADDATGKIPEIAQRGADMLEAVARLKPGIPAEQARADLSRIAQNLAARYPDTNKQFTSAIVQPQIDRIVGATRPALRILFAAVSLVLLIACANVAGLLLARASGRRTEIAIRLAMGASRAAIIRQILAESIVLAVSGGALGMGLATWILDAFLRIVPSNLPRADHIGVDGTVLAFLTAVSVLTGILFGVAPGWRMSRVDPALNLKEGTRSVASGREQHRLHAVLVIAETSVAMVLLVGAGLLVRSFMRVLQADPGFDPRHVLVGNINLPQNRYSDAKRVEFYERLLPRVAAFPGVRAVTAGFPLPLSGNHIVISFQIEGRRAAPGDEPSEALGVAMPGYFEALRIPVLNGREFTARDDGKSKPVILINERFARKYFPGENPVGKHIKSDLGDGNMNSPMREVVGVVGNTKGMGLTAEPDAQYYLPWAQAMITSPPLCIRTVGDPASVVGALRAELARIDPSIPLYRVSTLEDYVYKAAAHPRFQTLLLASFAGMALLLAAVGLYAVLSYMVVQRTAEIGVRMALGAERRDILLLVLRRGVILAGAGAIIGFAGSLVATRSIAAMLYAVRPFDVLTYATMFLVLFMICLAACAVPAYRAARVDPMNTLRQQ